jgi:hypothetical protein
MERPNFENLQKSLSWKINQKLIFVFVHNYYMDRQFLMNEKYKKKQKKKNIAWVNVKKDIGWMYLSAKWHDWGQPRPTIS